MKTLVTGAAGFIGSHLAERLLQDGYEVCGVDKFLENYPRQSKEQNLSGLLRHPRFRFVEGDLVHLSLPELIDGAVYVFHLAAQPGVRASWGKEFEQYTHNNLLATQRLLEACKGSRIEKFVFASSSSVYGDTTDLPMREDGVTHPVSPYGMTKLAGEHLGYLYYRAFEVPVVSLRYFTVYGPRQRPDMGFHIFMRSLLRNEELPLYDDGEQTRDFTFYSDIVDGTLAAAQYPGFGEIFNLGGGCRTTLNEVLQTLATIAGRKLRMKKLPRQAGDVRHTAAELGRARDRLGFNPRVGLLEGLSQEWEWLRSWVK
ncbi:MAG: NAD-dependent epimerase/dehydratase family protein [Candidatus Binatia bacterium]